MDRASKEKIVSSLNKAFDESNFLIVTQNEGLTVEEMSSLRNTLREEADTSFRVAKNSLAKIAVDNTSAKSLEALFCKLHQPTHGKPELNIKGTALQSSCELLRPENCQAPILSYPY